MIQDLGAGEKMQAPKLEGRVGQDLVDGLAQPLLVDAERGGLTTHAHGPTLGVGDWIDSQCDRRLNPESSGNRADPHRLREGLDMDLPDAFDQRMLELGVRLAGTGKQNLSRWAPGGPRQGDLAGRSHLETATFRHESLQQRRIRVGLDRVADAELGRVGAPRGEPTSCRRRLRV